VQQIRKQFPELNDSHRFTKNFRVAGNAHLEKIAIHGRSLLLESTEKARVFLEKEFGSLSDQGSTGAPRIDGELLHSSTCVVCRTNGQVLRLAGQLHEKNIPFQIARDKNEYLPPPWLNEKARAQTKDSEINFMQYSTRTRGRTYCDWCRRRRRWSDRCRRSGSSGNGAWRLLGFMDNFLTEEVINPGLQELLPNWRTDDKGRLIIPGNADNILDGAPETSFDWVLRDERPNPLQDVLDELNEKPNPLNDLLNELNCDEIKQAFTSETTPSSILRTLRSWASRRPRLGTTSKKG
jgi:hypothetical protein